MFAFSVFQVKPQLCTGSQMLSPERNLPLLLCALWGWRGGVHVKLKLPLLWSLHCSPSECLALCWEFWAETQWEPGPSSLMPPQFYQPHYSDTEIHQDQLHLLLFWVMILFLQTAFHAHLHSPWISSLSHPNTDPWKPLRTFPHLLHLSHILAWHLVMASLPWRPDQCSLLSPLCLCLHGACL